jgi:hypothetical protein
VSDSVQSRADLQLVTGSSAAVAVLRLAGFNARKLPFNVKGWPVHEFKGKEAQAALGFGSGSRGAAA